MSSDPERASWRISSDGSLSITRLLDAARQGDAAAYDQVLPLLYAELRAIASRHMRGERADHTLQPTALVHEAFLRVRDGSPVVYDDRTHFLRAASQTMRRVLVDYARARNAEKRSGGLRVTLHEEIAGTESSFVDVLALEEALQRLAEAEPRWANVVELRIFAGLEVSEVAAMLDISPATVKRDWQFAKAWLARTLRESGIGEPTT